MVVCTFKVHTVRNLVHSGKTLGCVDPGILEEISQRNNPIQPVRCSFMQSTVAIAANLHPRVHE